MCRVQLMRNNRQPSDISTLLLTHPATPCAPLQLEEEKAAHAERQGKVHDELREAQVC